VERDRESELDAREQYGVEAHSLILSLAATRAAAYNVAPSEMRYPLEGRPQKRQRSFADDYWLSRAFNGGRDEPKHRAIRILGSGFQDVALQVLASALEH
jgi:hypothetical protein